MNALKLLINVFISCLQSSVQLKFLSSFDNSSIKLVSHSIIHKSAKSYLCMAMEKVFVCIMD